MDMGDFVVVAIVVAVQAGEVTQVGSSLVGGNGTFEILGDCHYVVV